MAESKDYIIGGLAVALVAGLPILYYGTRFERTSEARNARIAGEAVEIRTYENNWFGGGHQICTESDGICYSPSAYKNRLEEQVDAALEEVKDQ